MNIRMNSSAWSARRWTRSASRASRAAPTATGRCAPARTTRWWTASAAPSSTPRPSTTSRRPSSATAASSTYGPSSIRRNTTDGGRGTSCCIYKQTKTYRFRPISRLHPRTIITVSPLSRAARNRERERETKTRFPCSLVERERAMGEKFWKSEGWWVLLGSLTRGERVCKATCKCHVIGSWGFA